MINQNREHVVFVLLFQVGAESFLMSDVDNENMLAGQTLTSRLLSQKSMIYKWDCLIICYLYKALKLKLVSTNKLFLEQSISDFCASIVNCLSLLQKIQDMKMGISDFCVLLSGFQSSLLPPSSGAVKNKSDDIFFLSKRYLFMIS